MVCYRLIVSGRVQGVFYREYCRKKACELGLNGFVRNRENSTVEAVAEGEKEKVDELIAWCWKGSTASSVEKVEVREIKDNKEKFSGFSVRY